MIWAEAEGCRVVDSQGRGYIDLSGGFGVAALGHRNPGVQAAVSQQAVRCMHALGDLAEADVTYKLKARLGGHGREVMLGVTGEDAVEIALRTALLTTGRPGIVAFTVHFLTKDVHVTLDTARIDFTAGLLVAAIVILAAGGGFVLARAREPVFGSLVRVD